MSSPKIYFNGVRRDGRPRYSPVTEDELAARLLSDAPDWHRRPPRDPRQIPDPTRHPIYDVDPHNLKEAGWGTIYPAGMDRRIKTALRRLLDLRAEQTGRKREDQEFHVRPGEDAESFLKRYKALPGQAHPDRIPYYLMIVGDPTEIPYSFQFDLDLVYAVGRLYFPTREGYSNYARNVVTNERRRLVDPELTFFGPRNPGDRTTERTTQELLDPLAESVTFKPPRHSPVSWDVQRVLNEDATYDRLAQMLNGEETPNVLVAACHGLVLDPDDERLMDEQGALLCSDWEAHREVEVGDFLAAQHILPKANLQGLIAFHIACHSAGTRATDSFPNKKGTFERQAPHSFLSKLPQRMLEQGALAVIGHVDRAWTSSFSWHEPGQPQIFESVLRSILDGGSVGAAMEYFAFLQSDLYPKLDNGWDDRTSLSPTETQRFVRRRQASRDARNFVVLGDPAVVVGQRR